jgi:hypothetical protein
MPAATTGIPRFIVGLPRAGTTWMCRSLNEHPDAVAFGETMFWGKAHVPPRQNGSYNAAEVQCVKRLLLMKPFESSTTLSGTGGMQHIGPNDLHRLIEAAFATLPDRASPADVFQAVANCIAQAEGKSAWVEKTPHHLLYATRILRHYPNARFVVMMRDPYSFLLSYKHQSGHENSDASRQRFKRRYHPAGGALVWKNSWRAAQHLLRIAPDQALLVRMEQVARDPHEVMRRVQEFLGLRFMPAASDIDTKVNSAFEKASKTLSDADVAWMNLIAGRDIVAAGYELRRSARNAGAILASAANLLLWAPRILLDLKRTTSGSLFQHVWRWLVRERIN